MTDPTNTPTPKDHMAMQSGTPQAENTENSVTVSHDTTIHLDSVVTSASQTLSATSQQAIIKTNVMKRGRRISPRTLAI
jgi:hypothetical protein